MPNKKRSSRRLSSLFSLGSNSDQPDTGSVASSNSTGRLTKVKNRLSSATHLAPEYPPPPAPAYHSASIPQPTIQPVESAPPALEVPPPPISDSRSRSPSPAPLATTARPATPNAETGGSLLAPVEGVKKLRRRSKLFGGGQSSDERVHQTGGQPGGQHSPLAWVIGHRGKIPYNLALLLNGEKVPELWDDDGDTLVYLFPRTSGRGPSFRLDSSVYAASGVMTRLVHGRLYSESTVVPPNQLPDRTLRNSAISNNASSRTASPDAGFPEESSDGSKGSRTLSDATEDDHTENHLYMPIALSTDSSPITSLGQESKLTPADTDTLVTYRNFFAFLIGQSLVATERHPDIFDVFMRIADILQHYHFSNLDGSTFGEVAASSFDAYVDELNLADVRSSREKTVEAIVLGERLRSLPLYTEGFVHAAGKFDSINELHHAKFELISHKTTNRIARAAMDLEQRVQNIDTKLKDFDFPAIFAGIMNSDTADEKKMIRFKNWKIAFMSCRSFILDYYKSKYGSWLPKASSKKNNLTTSGLNRLVLQDLYRDMTSLYDLLVDRTNLTSRTADGFMSEDEGSDYESVTYRALRKVLSEHDRSTPPVQPPIPFDLPLYPSLKGSKGVFSSGDPKKDAKSRSRKLKGDELEQMIKQAHNPDSEQQTPFLDAFRHFELKHASGKTMEELWELRTGQWLFLYAVLQSLPMLVADAPGVRFTEGVEYFLCEVPRSGAPWGREDTNRSRTWFGVAGGSQVVSLPTDIVENGVEGVFRRSHCWKMAEKWSQTDSMLSAAVQESINASPLPPPPNFLGPESAARPRSQSPNRSNRDSVMMLGLEALPLPAGVAPANFPLQRPPSSNDPSKTFDAILGDLPQPTQTNKKKKK
ncbi:hypothetical protein K505DRAFT_270083 [Melanomma pulvis-pyrius CBS 109.77]|uniref:DUF8004 domain-containing protein n=1 Tax=Melanomma pulvis-pyrius CBS 109.77 TaxID=1314802 RepID=A0A6A6XLB2_9PLEO|nr:hypothetical protein K505DRAFT_270083 [Melanomma pulvis-pyrius CBS 109.77]